MGPKFNFSDLCLMHSTIVEKSSQKNLVHQGGSNLLKIKIEILKNGKNNGYQFRFLALLKTTFCSHHFSYSSHSFLVTEFFLVSFCSSDVCATLHTPLFSFSIQFSHNCGESMEKVCFYQFFLLVLQSVYIWACSKKTKLKLKNPLCVKLEDELRIIEQPAFCF